MRAHRAHRSRAGCRRVAGLRDAVRRLDAEPRHDDDLDGEQADHHCKHADDAVLPEKRITMKGVRWSRRGPAYCRCPTRAAGLRWETVRARRPQIAAQPARRSEWSTTVPTMGNTRDSRRTDTSRRTRSRRATRRYRRLAAPQSAVSAPIAEPIGAPSDMTSAKPNDFAMLKP